MLKIAPVYAIWLACVATASNVVVSKLATPYVTSAVFLFFACAIAYLCFCFVLPQEERLRLFDKDVRGKALGMGTFGTALPMTIFMVALNYTTPVNSAIDNQFEIIYSLILSAIILKERPTLKQIGGSMLVLAGVILIVIKGGTYVQAKGDFMILSSLWLFQLSHIFAKKLPADLSPRQIAAARAFYAMPALAVLIFALRLIQGPLLFSGVPTAWGSLGNSYYIVFPHGALMLWGTLLFSALINYFIGNTFWYTAIRNMDLSKATAIILSYPVFTYLFSALVGEDDFTLYKIIGMILAVGGAYIVTATVKKGDVK